MLSQSRRKRRCISLQRRTADNHSFISVPGCPGVVETKTTDCGGLLGREPDCCEGAELPTLPDCPEFNREPAQYTRPNQSQSVIRLPCRRQIGSHRQSLRGVSEEEPAAASASQRRPPVMLAVQDHVSPGNVPEGSRVEPLPERSDPSLFAG